MATSKKKKGFMLIIVVIALYIFMGLFSLISIYKLHGNARVVNYVGIVRGATQRLVKRELLGYQDNELISQLDSIIEELISGHGSNNLIVLHDKIYLDNMQLVKTSWKELKTEIEAVRNAGDSTKLFKLSEAYFDLVDKTVSSAEKYSERQVQKSTGWLIALIIVGSVFYIRMLVLYRYTKKLDKVAYIDPLTQMPNRARCEQEICNYIANPPKQPIAVFIWDLNNLKPINDLQGHLAGDRIIADFARIIKIETAGYGLVGRYGGDEFLGLFPNANEKLVQNFLKHIDEKIDAYNLLHEESYEKISAAVGYVIENVSNSTLEDMINEADRLMYEKKSQMKKNNEI